MQTLRNFFRHSHFYGTRKTLKYSFNAFYFNCLRRFTQQQTARCRVHGYQMDVSLRTRGISRNLYVYGGREVDLRYMLNHALQAGRTVVDIGANMGYYALYAAKLVGPGGKVVALEPDPRNFDLLCKNVSINSMEKVIKVLPYALSDHAGEAQFFLNERSNWSALAVPGESPSGTGVMVQVAAASDIMTKYAPVDLIRMDIEGHEAVILDALSATAEVNPEVLPKNIVMEVHHQHYGKDKLDMESALQRCFSHGYHAELASCMLDLYPTEMKSLGYIPIKTLRSDFHIYGLFRDLRSDDVIHAVCEMGIVRHLLLRKSSDDGLA